MKEEQFTEAAADKAVLHKNLQKTKRTGVKTQNQVGKDAQNIVRKKTIIDINLSSLLFLIIQ